MPTEVTLIPGDWIGPETIAVAQAIVDAAGADIRWDTHHIGPEGVTERLLDSCRRTGVVLKARVGDRPESGQATPTVELRKRLGLWGNIRPAKALPGYAARFPDVDLVVVREISEGIYAGFEHEVTDGVYEAIKITTRAACERIARYAYRYAQGAGRKRITIVHKSNIMKMSDGLFLRTCQAVAEGFPEIQTDEVIVDALCMRLVRRPSDFDVLLTANLFGDIVGDLCSGLAGGITASPSKSRGDDVYLFENPHGKTPSLVGTGKANPIPMIRTANLMLRHIGRSDAADRIKDAVHGALEQGELRTPDIGGTDTCEDVLRTITARL